MLIKSFGSASCSDAAGQILAGMPGAPEASFSALPPSKTLTLGMDVPKSWLVEPVAAVHDLDNIRLEDVGDPEGLQADFELEALLLSGSCIDLGARRQDEVSCLPPPPLPPPFPLPL